MAAVATAGFGGPRRPVGTPLPSPFRSPGQGLLCRAGLPALPQELAGGQTCSGPAVPAGSYFRCPSSIYLKWLITAELVLKAEPGSIWQLDRKI